MGARELLVDLADEGLSVSADGDRLVIRPASKLTDTMRAALRKAKPDLLALLSGARIGALAAVAWTDVDMALFLNRRARLLRWGWPESEAEKLADRLVRRDRESDPRLSCADCDAFRPGRCGNHQSAGLKSPEVGRDLVALLQRCPGYRPTT